MAEKIRFVEQGTVTTPKGFVAGATFAGMKTYAEDKLDLGILLSQSPCSAAGTFTTNSFKSPSVLVNQEHLTKGKVRALVANSGIANACVGDPGLKDAREMASLAAHHLGVKSEEVLVCSTGIIGVELPMALLRTSMGQIQLQEEGGHHLARAILTTDTFTKEAAVAFEMKGTTITLGGIAKGSGMIHPDMATMLCFLATDAEINESLLRKTLKEAVDGSFNMLSVDGDTSTNDTVLLLANGAAEAGPIEEGSEAHHLFKQALTKICVLLTRAIAQDGEGATKLMEVIVEGASSVEDARKAARTVVSSTLVKSAVHGADPNWGRILAAVGRSGAAIKEENLALYVNDVCIMEEGKPISFHREAVVAIMMGEEVSFRIHLNLGDGKATAWGCDLSEEYVTFNSAYTT